MKKTIDVFSTLEIISKIIFCGNVVKKERNADVRKNIRIFMRTNNCQDDIFVLK